MSNEKKSEQLGMPYGTANGKLRKAIMYDMVKRLGENICYQCNKEIKSAEDLSIEHKIPWLDNDTNLFWSLDNIAFSHTKCNYRAARKENKIKNGKRSGEIARQNAISARVREDGYIHCSTCNEFKDQSAFTKREKTRLFNYCNECNECRRKKRRKNKS